MLPLNIIFKDKPSFLQPASIADVEPPLSSFHVEEQSYRLSAIAFVNLFCEQDVYMIHPNKRIKIYGLNKDLFNECVHAYGQQTRSEKFICIIDDLLIQIGKSLKMLKIECPAASFTLKSTAKQEQLIIESGDSPIFIETHRQALTTRMPHLFQRMIDSDVRVLQVEPGQSLIFNMQGEWAKSHFKSLSCYFEQAIADQLPPHYEVAIRGTDLQFIFHEDTSTVKVVGNHGFFIQLQKAEEFDSLFKRMVDGSISALSFQAKQFLAIELSPQQRQDFCSITSFDTLLLCINAYAPHGYRAAIKGMQEAAISDLDIDFRAGSNIVKIYEKTNGFSLCLIKSNA